VPTQVFAPNWKARMVACFDSETPASEVIAPWRNDHTRGDLKRCHKPFPMRIPGKLEMTPDSSCTLIATCDIPRFHVSVRIGVAKIIFLEHFLPHPAGTALIWKDEADSLQIAAVARTPGRGRKPSNGSRASPYWLTLAEQFQRSLG